MTCKAWTSEAQLAWLQERKGGFLQALQTKMLLKDFFPKILQDFQEKWPVDETTDKEIASAESVERANKLKRNKYDRISLPVFLRLNLGSPYL